jgi:hypothetical protein
MEAKMKRPQLVQLAALLAFAVFTLPGGVAESFAVGGRLLSQEECAGIDGGETHVDIDRGRDVARVVSIPRDRYGMDYSRATCYSVEVHNNFISRTQKDKTDYYDTTSFPSGRANMAVAYISDGAKRDKYGSSQGRWITTDACAKVTAYPFDAAGKADKSQPYTRNDYGYFWHTNNEAPFQSAKSLGCLISRKADIDRVIRTLDNDHGRKSIDVR